MGSEIAVAGNRNLRHQAQARHDHLALGERTDAHGAVHTVPHEVDC
jgi:hypothetical protein